MVRRGALFGAAIMLLVLVPALSSHALDAARPAQERPDGPSVGGILRDPERNPVPDVDLLVARDGEEIGVATTAADGSWVLEVPEPGSYQVAIDVDTLPEGLGLRDPERQTLDDVRVREGFKPVNFLLGEGTSSAPTRVERLLNLAVAGLRIGLIIAVAAVGLSLVFGITGLTNFAHGELVTFGALIAYLLSTSPVLGDVPLVVAGALAVVAGAGFGYLHERAMFRPLRRRRTGNVALIVVTIGLSIFLRNLYLVIFGGGQRQYDEFTIQVGLDLGPISPRAKDLVVIGIAAFVLVVVAVLLQRTRLGTGMRAVADSSELASASGIDVNGIILITWVSAGALAALGGVLYGVSEQIESDLGFQLLLLMFAAVVLGGIGTAYGPMLGGLLIGLVSSLSTYWIDTKYKTGVALAVLILVVLVRPQGILGKRERIG
ncbi:MAG TPA: branched-chain amino acid ABC transporter permease [Acidimicrobiia bacterium]|nr:branched-chain amino acid ABC transporter permease [Acidimicrobiia bacterium]